MWITKEDAQRIVDMAEPGEKIPIAAFAISFRELTQEESNRAKTIIVLQGSEANRKAPSLEAR